MVKILEFHGRQAPAAARESGAVTGRFRQGHSADVIIFPGVRIERQPQDDGGGDVPTRSAGRNR